MSEIVAITDQLATRWGVQPAKMWELLDAVFPGVQRGNMFGALILAKEHKLNPFLGEINILETKKGMKPYVTVDGYIRIVQDHPQYDGSTTTIDFDQESGKPISATCTIHRKDRKHPEVHTEFYEECYKNTPPWNSKPCRMIKHRAFMQCARYAFGFGGLIDREEAEEVLEAEFEVKTGQASSADANAKIKGRLGIDDDNNNGDDSGAPGDDPGVAAASDGASASNRSVG